MAHTFLWIGTGGDFGTAANWVDQTLGGIASVAPGTADVAWIVGPASPSFQVVSGWADVADLSFTGATLLLAQVSAQSFEVGTASGNGAVTVSGSTTVLIAGTLTLGAAGTPATAGALTVTLNSLLLAGAMVMNGLSSLSISGGAAVEIGNAFAVVPGRLVIDPGSTLSATNGTVNAPVTNNGIILAGGYGLTLAGNVVGSGTVQIGAGARLDLSYGSAGSGETVAFLGSTGTLFTPLTGFSASIAGFAVGDAIVLGQTADSVAYFDNFNGTGLLRLRQSGTLVQTLTVAGSYTNAQFLVSGGTLSILASGVGGSGGASPGSAGPDLYAWNAGGGDWRTAGNWSDITSGETPAVIAPGSNDLVSVTGAGGASYQTLTGLGNAASLTLAANVALAGSFSAANLAIGGTAAGNVIISGGYQVAAGAVQLLLGTLALNGAGAVLNVAGTISLGDPAPPNPAGVLSLANGATLLAGGVAMNALSRISVDASSTLEIGTLGNAAAGYLTVDAGATLVATNGTVAAPIADDGVIAVGGYGLSVTGAVHGAGQLQIGAGARLDLSYASAVNGVTVGFQAATGVLYLPAFGFTATIAGFRPGDVIGSARSIDHASYAATSANRGTLTLSLGGTTVTTLTLAGIYTGASFFTASNAIVVTGTVACFAAGTRILTARGEVPVELLREGEAVVTLAGTAAALKPIQWIGRARSDPAGHAAPHRITPIRVRADAIAPGVPHADVLLSPDHAILIDGALMSVHVLINGASIVREPITGPIDYYHVELAKHDVILAEGMRVESYLDTGNRRAFADGVAEDPRDARLSPRALAAWARHACAPLKVRGPDVVAAHARLALRAQVLGHRRTAAPGLRIMSGDIELPASRSAPDRWRVAIPAGIRSVRLRSRSVVPEALDRRLDDRRVLGVAVARITIDGQVLDRGSARLTDGWYDDEDDAPWRWTNGDAGLNCGDCRVIEIRISRILEYWEAPNWDAGPALRLSIGKWSPGARFALPVPGLSQPWLSAAHASPHAAHTPVRDPQSTPPPTPPSRVATAGSAGPLAPRSRRPRIRPDPTGTRSRPRRLAAPSRQRRWPPR